MVLDGLRAELGEERYRAAPLLRRMVSEGRLGMATGEGFYVYEHEHDARRELRSRPLTSRLYRPGG